jgi:hypothetical protein
MADRSGARSLRQTTTANGPVFCTDKETNKIKAHPSPSQRVRPSVCVAPPPSISGFLRASARATVLKLHISFSTQTDWRHICIPTRRRISHAASSPPSPSRIPSPTPPLHFLLPDRLCWEGHLALRLELPCRFRSPRPFNPRCIHRPVFVKVIRGHLPLRSAVA